MSPPSRPPSTPAPKPPSASAKSSACRSFRARTTTSPASASPSAEPAAPPASFPAFPSVNILVANLGSTSFKYRLFRCTGSEESMLAKGGFERVTDFGRAIEDCLAALKVEGHVRDPGDVHGVGFKTVHGGDVTGCLPADEKVEQALMALADLAPAHNPAYAAGIRQFRAKLPGVPLVALFETAFYQWVPDHARRYAVPESWHAIGVRRYGFHGASHKFIAERSAELLGRED